MVYSLAGHKPGDTLRNHTLATPYALRCLVLQRCCISLRYLVAQDQAPYVTCVLSGSTRTVIVVSP